jgi:hypothetical protein
LASCSVSAVIAPLPPSDEGEGGAERPRSECLRDRRAVNFRHRQDSEGRGRGDDPASPETALEQLAAAQQAGPERPHRRAQFAGGLLRRLALQVAQDDRTPILFRQQRNLLVQDRQRFAETHIRVRLGLARCIDQIVDQFCGPTREALAELPGQAGGDAVQETPDGRLLADSRCLAGEDEEGGLKNVLGVVRMVEDPTADAPHQPAVPPQK